MVTKKGFIIKVHIFTQVSYKIFTLPIVLITKVYRSLRQRRMCTKTYRCLILPQIYVPLTRRVSPSVKRSALPFDQWGAPVRILFK